MKNKPRIRIQDLEFEEYLSAERIRQKVLELGQRIAEDYADAPPLFLAVLNGAFVFAADLVRATPLPTQISFVKLSSYDGLQSSGEIKSLIGIDPDVIRDRDIIVVEDIVDTGRTLRAFIGQLKRARPRSVRIASLLLKPEALEAPLHIDYLGFSIPPAFVIGYGLDFDEHGRQLPAIYQKI